MEMIVDFFPIIDPLTSGLKDPENPLATWNRHRAFSVLAATCTRLRALFYPRSWITRIVTPRALPETVALFREVGNRLQVHPIEYVSPPPLDCRTLFAPGGIKN